MPEVMQTEMGCHALSEPRNRFAMFDRLLHEGKVALILLTRLPMGNRLAIDGEAIQSCALFFPLIGAGLGYLAAVPFTLAIWAGLPPLIAACLAVATMVLLTGARPEEGLGQAVEAFVRGRTPADKLAFLRRPGVGGLGVVALVVSVLLRLGALSALAEPRLATAALVGLGALSRAPLPAAKALLPPLRLAALPAPPAGPLAPRAVGAVGLGAVIAGMALGPLPAAAALLAAALAAILIGALAIRLAGGISDGMLGAIQQTAESAGLLAVAALAPHLLV